MYRYSCIPIFYSGFPEVADSIPVDKKHVSLEIMLVTFYTPVLTRFVSRKKCFKHASLALYLVRQQGQISQ